MKFTYISSLVLLVHAIPLNTGSELIRAPGRKTFEIPVDNTDDACAAIHPGSKSEDAASSAGNIEFYCRVADGELLGMYTMSCPKYMKHHSIVIYTEASPTNPNNQKAKCREISQEEYDKCQRMFSQLCGTSSSPSVDTRMRSPARETQLNDLAGKNIGAGSVDCVDSPPVTSQHRQLIAYTTFVGHVEHALATYISWYELRPTPSAMGRQANTDHLKIGKPVRGAIYRACAYAPAGTANLRLHITDSISS